MTLSTSFKENIPPRDRPNTTPRSCLRNQSPPKKPISSATKKSLLRKGTPASSKNPTSSSAPKQTAEEFVIRNDDLTSPVVSQSEPNMTKTDPRDSLTGALREIIQVQQAHLETRAELCKVSFETPRNNTFAKLIMTLVSSNQLLPRWTLQTTERTLCWALCQIWNSRGRPCLFHPETWHHKTNFR